MEKVNARRGFLKGFGLVGAVVGGVVTGREMMSNNTPAPLPVTAVEPKVDISHLAPKEGATSLVITGDNRPPPPPSPVYSSTQNGYTLSCSTNVQSSLIITSNYQSCPDNERNKVSMAVGKDDRLWIRVGDQWKRVALEG